VRNDKDGCKVDEDESDKTAKNVSMAYICKEIDTVSQTN